MRAERLEMLNRLIDLATTRAVVAVHYTRDGAPGVAIGLVESCDAKHVFVASAGRTRPAVIPTHSITTIAPVMAQ